MADPNGFQKVADRQLPPDRPVAERLQDWCDIHAPIPAGGQPWLTAQASRCMDCGVPFCHFSCPLGNLIPEWNDLIWRGQVEDAIDRMHATNNFPEFTGRICPAPCESGCVLGLIAPPVTIRNIEMAIGDAEFAAGPLIPQIPSKNTGATVAVVGSGPAGLACAQQLTRAGHTVVVYERADKIGGLLRYGIPDFKLEKHLIDRRIAQMESEGTRFRPSTEIGTDISWDDLSRRFDAVVCAIGSTLPIDLPVPGRDLKGIEFAMNYLAPANRAVAATGVTSSIETSMGITTGTGTTTGTRPAETLAGCDDTSSPPSAAGKHVVVIGGGDTGSDCLGTALRQGAKTVTTLQVFDQPPTERPDHQPWPTMPMVFKLSSSHEEGGTVEYLANTVEFVNNGSGAVKALKVAQTDFGADGKLGYLPGTEREIPADLVLLAIGFKAPDTSNLVAQLGTELTERGLIARDESFTWNKPGFFVCGDAGRGQSLVVWAIAEGRSCAAAVDTYLQGATELPAPIKASTAPLRF